MSGELAKAMRGYTPARVALERAGATIATAEHLAFQLDHALARDAVHAKLDVMGMMNRLRQIGLEGVALRSAVEPGPGERQSYLRRPDLGRRLAENAAITLREVARENVDVVFVIADGLSALAVERHALALLNAVKPLFDAQAVSIGPACVVSQGRVAIGDEIGAILRARMLVMLIGERPGLSAADSLGIYVTWEPRVGRTDAERNCISNVRLEGLSYADAATRIVQVFSQAQRQGVTGVALRGGGRSEVNDAAMISAELKTLLRHPVCCSHA